MPPTVPLQALARAAGPSSYVLARRVPLAASTSCRARSTSAAVSPTNTNPPSSSSSSSSPPFSSPSFSSPSSLSPSTSTVQPASSSPSTAKPPPTIPPLSRPPGTSDRPSTSPKTWEERKTRMLDDARHKAKRKALLKEARQGYFHDFGEMKKEGGGKAWVAPRVLIREDKALYFPDVSGKNLLHETVHTTDLFADKVSLLVLLNTRISEEHIASFVPQVLVDQQGKDGFQYIQINHQANRLKSMLLSIFLSSLKRTVPEHLWPTYLLSTGEWDEIDVSMPLGIQNRLLGYVFLVDQHCKVRWAACGSAHEGEVEALRAGTEVLMERLRQSRLPPSPAASPSAE